MPGHALHGLLHLLHHRRALRRSANGIAGHLKRHLRGLFDGLFALDLCGNHRGELDHPHQFSLRIIHRVVTRFQPHFVPVPVQAAETAGDVAAGIERSPKFGICRAGGIFCTAKHPVMLTHHFIEPVSHARQEGVIGGQHIACQIELDDRAGAQQRVEQRLVLPSQPDLFRHVAPVCAHLAYPPLCIQPRIPAQAPPCRLAIDRVQVHVIVQRRTIGKRAGQPAHGLGGQPLSQRGAGQGIHSDAERSSAGDVAVEDPPIAVEPQKKTGLLYLLQALPKAFQFAFTLGERGFQLPVEHAGTC
ncbi:hypothetical protein D3C79_660590 [compost metagenome]